MPTEYIEITDEMDNVEYPHTHADVVFFPDSTVENLVKRTSMDVFMIKDNKYYPKEYDIPGYIRGGEIWFTGDYITQMHYIGVKITITSGMSNKISLSITLDDNEDANMSSVVVACLDQDYNTLSVETPTFVPGTMTVSSEITTPGNTKFLLVGVTGEPSRSPIRLARGFSIIDSNTNVVNLTGFREDLRSGKEVVNTSKELQLEGNLLMKILVSDTKPSPESGKVILWIDTSAK